MPDSSEVAELVRDISKVFTMELCTYLPGRLQDVNRFLNTESSINPSRLHFANRNIRWQGGFGDVVRATLLPVLPAPTDMGVVSLFRGMKIEDSKQQDYDVTEVAVKMLRMNSRAVAERVSRAF